MPDRGGENNISPVPPDPGGDLKFLSTQLHPPSPRRDLRQKYKNSNSLQRLAQWYYKRRGCDSGARHNRTIFANVLNEQGFTRLGCEPFVVT